MNKLEVAELLKTIIRYYPNFKFDDMDKTTNAWLLILHDEDGYVVGQNLAEYVKTKVYPPVIADLLKASDGNRYIPNGEETQLLLQKHGEVATKEVQDKAIAEIKALTEGFVNKHE